MVQSDLIGQYVNLPREGDAGWVRAVYVANNHLFVLVQRDNVSKDFRAYFAVDLVMPEDCP